MFGLFQADLPIGNRLWLALLALATAGTLAATPLASTSSTPAEFVTGLLSLYGQATAIEILLFVPITILYLLVDEFLISPRKPKLHPFFMETDRPVKWMSRILQFMSPIFFVFAIIWSVNNQIYPELAALGIFILLFSELYRVNSFDRDAYEFVNIKQRSQKQTLNAQLTPGRVKKSYRFKAEWMDAVVFLCDNKWEIVEITEQAEQGLLKSGLFKRKYLRNILSEILKRKSLLPEEILDDNEE